MDKFDQQISKAKPPFEPKTNFVEDTMNQLPNQKPHHRWSMKIWAPAITGVVAVAIIAFVVWPRPSANAPATNQNSSSQPSASAPLTTGTDNASLSSDLNSIQSSLDQSAKDQTGAEGAVNDNQNQIAVPTN